MGIKTASFQAFVEENVSSEKPPHHMGIKTSGFSESSFRLFSEKPPHHMGIKTRLKWPFIDQCFSLKNLPTTWGLRQTTPFNRVCFLTLKNLPTTRG